jgi:phage-related minor tail protein
VAESNVKLRVDARDAVNALKKTNDSAKKLNQTLGKTEKKAATATGNIQRMGVSFRTTVGSVVALTGVVTLFSRSLNVLGERQANVAALSNGLEKLGAGERELVRLKEAADELGKATLFDQEDFTQGFALLTSFQSIGVESFKRVAEAAADVATLTGQDVNSSLLQLAKALQDPVRGLTALSRSGTQFTDQQKEQIKALVESGKELEAQDFILQEIEKQYANAARAAGSAGYAGSVDSLQESFRDFQERLATGVQPAVAGTLTALTDLFDLVSKIPEPVGQAALGIGATAAAIIALKAAAAAAIPVVKTLFAFLAANPFVALAAGITAATVALAGYRNEAERVADAAVGGGAAEIQAARAKLIETEQEISLKKLELKGATGKEAQQIKRELRRLRSDAEALRKSVPRAKDPVTPDGDQPKPKPKPEPDEDEAKRLAQLLASSQQRIQSLRDQTTLAGALTEEERRQFQLNIDLRKIKENTAGLTKKQVQSEIEARLALEDQRDTTREINEANEKRKKDADELARKLEEQQAAAKQLADTIKNQITDAIMGAIDGTKSLGESLSSVLKMMAASFLNQGIGGIGKALKIPGFARGGQPPVGRPSIVGERGPELFVPSRAGTIVPNNQLGGSTSVVVNVDASGTEVQGNQGNADQLGRLIGQAVQAELIKQKRPGGLLTR